MPFGYGYGDHVPAAPPLWLMKPLSYAHAMMRTTMRVPSANAARELGWTPAYASSCDGLAALTGSG